jgi:solute carrier family 50 protein (sugar transporter)
MGEASMEIFTRTIAPILGFLLANVMFFASVPELQKYRKMNEWGSLNSHPYPIVVCNCIGWMMYGSVIKDYWVFVSNFPGLLVSVYALMIALTLNARNEKKRKELEKMVLVSCALLSVMGFVLGVVMHGDEKEGKKRFASGIFCNVVLAIYYASPLSEMRQIIMERDASSLYWPMSVAITVNGFSWAAYGFALKDWFLVSPNMFRGVLGVVQLTFLATFGKNTKKKKMMMSSSINSVKIELEERGGGEEEEEEEEINIVAYLSSEDLIVSGQPRS